jgi:single-strand DNA-binding protein
MYNKVTLCGRLGKDPKSFPADDPQRNFAVFSLATNSGKNRTEWHACKCFGKTADLVIQYLKKGSAALVEGRIEYNDFTDQQGNHRVKAEILVTSVTFISTRDPGTVGEMPAAARPQEFELDEPAKQPTPGNLDFEDIPF